MSIFHEIQFPTAISYGSRGGPATSTSIVEGDSGSSERIARWPNARRRYDAKYGVRKSDDLNLVGDFYIARQGPVCGFRWKDWLDFTTAANHRAAPSATDITLGTAADSSQVQWQLRTQYVSGPTTVYRTIEKPVTGTVLVSKNNTPTTAFTLNSSTGVITLNSVAGGDVIKIGCEFDVPVQFAGELDWLQAALENFDSGSIDSIPIVEMVGTTTSPADYYYGGSTTVTTAGSFNYEFSMGRVLAYLNNASTTIFMPDATDIELGGVYVHIFNAGSGTVTLKDYTGTVTIATLSAGKSGHMVVFNDGTVNKWKAMIGN